jgi:ferritin-like protein
MRDKDKEIKIKILITALAATFTTLYYLFIDKF